MQCYPKRTYRLTLETMSLSTHVAIRRNHYRHIRTQPISTMSDIGTCRLVVDYHDVHSHRPFFLGDDLVANGVIIPHFLKEYKILTIQLIWLNH